MWRSLRSLRAPLRPVPQRFISPRRQLRFQSYMHGYQENQAQHVRFTRSFKWSQTLLFVSRVVALYLIYHCTIRFLDQNFLQDAEEQLAEMQAQKKKEEEKEAEGKEDEFEIPDETPAEGTFIPLWFPKQKPLVMFDGSEPEWKSMVAFTRNKEERAKLEKNLIRFFVKQYGTNQALLQQIGERKSDKWAVSSTQFDYTFPPHKPPEYERFGLEITDDATYTVTRSMSAFDYLRLRNTVFPESIARSVWSGGSVVFGSSYDKMKGLLKEKLGKAEDAIPQPEIFSLGPVSKSDKEADPKLGAETDHMGADKPSGPGQSSTDSNKTTSQSTNATSWRKSLIINSVPALPKPTKDTTASAKATMKTLSQTWSPQFVYKSGMIVVDGMMRVEGQRCVTRLHFLALYSPLTKEWFPLSGEIKHTRPRQMRPQGIRKN